MIVAGLGTCVTLMLKSNSKDEEFHRSIQHVADASLQMAMEIEMANGIATASPEAIEFCVPDRDGDSLPEQIRYEWRSDNLSSSTHLYRRFNQGPDVPVITRLNGFNLVYNYSNSSKISNRFQSETVLLKKVDSVPSVEYTEKEIDFANQLCICFGPEAKRSNTTWDLGSIEFMIRTLYPGAKGELRLRVTAVEPEGFPDLNRVYADVAISNQDLSSRYQYVEFPLAPIAQQSNNTMLAAILSTSEECPPIRVQCLTQSENLPDRLQMYQTLNSGTSWNTVHKVSPRFLAMGYSSDEKPNFSARRNLVSVDIFMSGLTHMDPNMMASAKLLAQPEVP